MYRPTLNPEGQRRYGEWECAHEEREARERARAGIAEMFPPRHDGLDPEERLMRVGGEAWAEVKELQQVMDIGYRSKVVIAALLWEATEPGRSDFYLGLRALELAHEVKRLIADDQVKGYRER